MGRATRLYYELLDHNAIALDFVRFLLQLHGQLRRPLILVCDRLPAHRSAIKQLKALETPWLKVEWLPAYSPELDPVEALWNQTKYGELANVVPGDIRELHKTLDQLLESYRHQPNRLHTFIDAAGLLG